jgi:adenine/guanine phosphoribosyltransferase-like PRPP-binding protein
MRPHDYWQRIDPAGALSSGPGEDGYVVDLDGGGQLVLPVRTLADGRRGLASLIINQASFSAQDRLAGDLARRLEPFRPEIVVGLPTLGLTLASAVARALGHERYVPLGTSRKFWYRDELSTPLSSVTTPDQKKTLYLDPRMTPVLEGRRVALVDDVISSGASIAAGMALMTAIGVEPVVIGAVMLQSSRWRARLDPKIRERIAALFSTPMLEKEPDGRWRPEEAATQDRPGPEPGEQVYP